MSLVNFNRAFFGIVVVKLVFQDIFNQDICFRSDEEYRDVESVAVLYDGHINFGEALMDVISGCCEICQ